MTTRGLLILCVLVALLGWFALGSFTYHNPPDALNRLIALAILWLTLLATFLPLVYVVNLRLSESDILPRAARQSALIALFLMLCVWLRMIRALNWANAILMLSLFIMTEVLLSTR